VHRRWPELRSLQHLSFFPSWKHLYRAKHVSYAKAPKSGFGSCKVGQAEFLGQWKGKRLNGLGMMIAHDGTLYEGFWRDGKYDGQVRANLRGRRC
jgi:hypothetical protein